MTPDDACSAILEALELAAPAEGLDIVSVELGGTRQHPLVRVRIEALDGSEADMQSIVERTPWVSQVIEELDPFPGSYELEVSSPGLDRPLRRARDFERFMGEEAEATLLEAVDGRKKGSGSITGVDGSAITLTVDGKVWSFDLAQLKSARLKPDYAALFAAAQHREAEHSQDSGSADEEHTDAGQQPAL